MLMKAYLFFNRAPRGQKCDQDMIKLKLSWKQRVEKQSGEAMSTCETEWR